MCIFFFSSRKRHTICALVTAVQTCALPILAAKLAVLLTEPGLGGRGVDVDARLQRWKGMKGDRAEGAWRLARRLAAIGEKLADDARSEERRVGKECVTTRRLRRSTSR